METEIFLQSLCAANDSFPYPLREYAFIDVADIGFTQAVRDACAMNRCGCYGKTWACPPGVGDWQTLKRHFMTYRRAMVYTTAHELEDSFDFEGMMAAKDVHAANDEYLAARLRETAGPFEIVGAAACDLCPKCTYPDAPCRFPDRKKKTAEACGIDVAALANTCGIRYTNGADTVTYFSVVFFV